VVSAADDALPTEAAVWCCCRRGRRSRRCCCSSRGLGTSSPHRASTSRCLCCPSSSSSSTCWARPGGCSRVGGLPRCCCSRVGWALQQFPRSRRTEPLPAAAAASRRRRLSGIRTARDARTAAAAAVTGAAPRHAGAHRTLCLPAGCRCRCCCWEGPSFAALQHQGWSCLVCR
jgi:hypothetical protein